MAWSDRLYGQIRTILSRLAEIERRLRNMSRVGTVVEVDEEKGLARVELSRQDGKPYQTAWIPWREQAMGAAKTHFPPSRQQQVRVSSPTGDLADAEIDLSVPSDTNKRPSERGDEYVLLEVGGVRISVVDGAIHLKAGNSEIVIKDGEITLASGGSVFTVKDGQITAKSSLIATDGETRLGDPAATDKVLLEGGPAERVKGI